MSRVGNKPIPLPKGVKITIGNELTVEGPKGKQTVPLPAGVTPRQQDGHLELQRDGDKTWDLGWVYTVIAGVLNIMVIYDALTGPAFLVNAADASGRKEPATHAAAARR